MKLIVGLGNPGREFESTRHNIGFMILDSIVNKLKLTFDKEKTGGLYCQTTFGNEKVIFLKPQEYINLSGDVIKRFLNYYKIDIKDMLIIHDDLDLNIGKYKIRYHGSSAGHNGLKNIEFNLKSDEYNRVKIGISNNKLIETKDYVLGKLTDEELKEINKIVETVDNIIVDFIKTDILTIMNKYNRR